MSFPIRKIGMLKMPKIAMLSTDGCKYNVLWNKIEDKQRRIDWENPESVMISENE